MLALFLALALVPLAYAQGDTNVTTIMAALQAANVTPGVVPTFTQRFPIEVVYTDSKTNTTFAVSAGSNLTMEQTANIPAFSIFSNNSQITGKPYLMAIVDPDVGPTGPFRHFLGADYISPGLSNGELPLANKSATATLTDYLAPGPPAGSGPHRYVVLCYLQNSTGVTPPASFNASNRNNFNITDFVDTVQGNNFTLLAATFFHVSANDTTGSVTPNSTAPTAAGASGTAPAASGSGSAGTGGAVTFKVSTVVAWSVVGAFTAMGALLL